MAVRALASRALFPALVGGTVWLALVGARRNLAAVAGLPPEANEAVVYAVAVLLAVAVLAVCERVLTFRPEWNVPQGDVRTDATHFVLSGIGTAQVAKVVVNGIVLSAAVWLSARLGHRPWPSDWPPVVRLALALAVAELGHYWFHRWSHERALLWRLHAVHHSALRLYVLNTTRFHPLDLFSLIVLQTAPLVLLGCDAETLLLYGTFTAVYGWIQHCNVDLRTGPLSWVFSTPELHRWHHSTDTREGNANYGAVLVLWDLVFGTFRWPGSRGAPARVGIADLPRFPRGYLAQLLAPLRWGRIAGPEGAAADALR